MRLSARLPARARIGRVGQVEPVVAQGELEGPGAVLAERLERLDPIEIAVAERPGLAGQEPGGVDVEAVEARVGEAGAVEPEPAIFAGDRDRAEDGGGFGAGVTKRSTPGITPLSAILPLSTRMFGRSVRRTASSTSPDLSAGAVISRTRRGGRSCPCRRPAPRWRGR